MSFDSVDIEGRPSISVRDLRSKIVRHKNLDICHDFDLVFSDAVTGQGQLSLSVPYVPVICSLFFYFSGFELNFYLFWNRLDSSLYQY